ncbi:hypothetical protein ACFWX5_22545 [[Kitasatospora] papulosa]|uniref:hypothetical protein n=1 Tax=[Kitasatospora] papulosa TaxID=1464011 RepID=UPI0036C0C24B
MKQNRSGVTENTSVSMPSEPASEPRSRSGRRGLSGYVTEAVRHQLAMDGLAEIVAAHEEEHGALTEQEIEAARRELSADEHTERGAV